jgi:hypothetical protein
VANAAAIGLGVFYYFLNSNKWVDLVDSYREIVLDSEYGESKDLFGRLN